ncbi:tax1-binding protein 1 homolog B-like isoform X1 [Alosa sapidissima]|uniref:tax1-binding protein 1 homolog B-like isoform X1 n=1 Tax=Alosa sapidissima TaxID=34773 RepID=UPI001C08D894|nr:tax1-binding protein 1 homolog B-like isoform X1 [Alosa sapidissima]
MEDHALYSAPPTPLPADSSPSPSPVSVRPMSNTESTYKLSEADLPTFVKLRASNRALFTGRRNSSKLAWRTILKEMGLQGKMSAWQAMKKWDNLKNRYKELKNPPPGVTVPPESWRWFKLMDDAMEGRLEGSAKVLSITSVLTSNDDEFLPSKRPSSKRHRGVEGDEEATGSQPELLLNAYDLWGSGVTGDVAQEMESDRRDIEQERAQLDSDHALMEKEREVLERERMVLERERAGLQRELAALDRDRAALERERASVERDRAQLDWKMAQLEKERAKLEREKIDIHRDRTTLKKDSTAGTNGGTSTPEEIKEVELDAEQLERRQRFLDLFEKLIEKF